MESNLMDRSCYSGADAHCWHHHASRHVQAAFGEMGAYSCVRMHSTAQIHHLRICLQRYGFLSAVYVTITRHIDALTLIKYAAFTIASDLILSLLPVTFILHLRRPLHEKILIGCLMGAGLASTGVAIARLFLIMGHLNLGKPGPQMNMVQDMLWGFELTLGILAASVPTLKAPVHRQLIKWGVLTAESASDTPPESFLGGNRIHDGSLFTRQMRKWDGTAAGGTENIKKPYMYSAPDEEPSPPPWFSGKT